jgi:hypothetical protein
MLRNCKFLYGLTLKNTLTYNSGVKRTKIKLRRIPLTSTLSLFWCLNNLNSASSQSLCLGFLNRFILDSSCTKKIDNFSFFIIFYLFIYLSFGS